MANIWLVNSTGERIPFPDEGIRVEVAMVGGGGGGGTGSSNL
jgi:hypothetical protein